MLSRCRTQQTRGCTGAACHAVQHHPRRRQATAQGYLSPPGATHHRRAIPAPLAGEPRELYPGEYGRAPNPAEDRGDVLAFVPLAHVGLWSRPGGHDQAAPLAHAARSSYLSRR